MAPPLSISPLERVAFVGKTQSGKTHAAGILAAPVRRLLVIDPKGRLSDAMRKDNDKYAWNLDDWYSKEGRRARANIESGKAGRLRVAAPIGGDFEPWFKWAYDQQNILVYVDEMYGVVSSTRPGKWLNALYTRGAELGVGVWAATQRPRNVPIVMFSESEVLLLFHLSQPDDKRRMAAEIGEKAYMDLPPHAFLFYRDSWDEPVRYSSIVSTDKEYNR